MDIANHAILQGDLAALREAVAAGIDLHQSLSHGNTLLRNAASRPVPGPLVLLLELGADPNHRSYYRSPVDKRFEAGFTPLMYVQTEEGAKELILRGADVNARSDCGMTALMRARTEAIARILVESGAMLDATDHQGTTALMFAAKGADADIVRYLIAKGANPNLRQHHSPGGKAYTAVRFAREGLKQWQNFKPEELGRGGERILNGFKECMAILESVGVHDHADSRAGSSN